MRARSFLLAPVALTVLACSSLAQHGRPDPDARRLRTGTDSLAVYLVRGADTTRTGTVRDELALVREGEREVLRRAYTTVDRMLGLSADTIVDSAPDLKPLTYRTHRGATVQSIDFTAGRATGWTRTGSGDSAAIGAVVGDAFDGASFDLVLRASSLREGWDVEVPVFTASEGGVVRIRARVTGVESIGQEPCWRVQATFTGMPVTFWIGQASRTLRQQVLEPRPGVRILFRAFPPPASDSHSA